LFKKKKKLPERNPHLGNGENQVYSYRSARNDQVRQFDRGEVVTETPKRHQSSGRLNKIAKLTIGVFVLVSLLVLLSYVGKLNSLTITSGGSNQEK